MHCVFVVDKVATTFYILGFWAPCFYSWSSYNKFLYVLDLLGIVFLLLIKLQQVFIHPWACIVFLFLIKLQQLFIHPWAFGHSIFVVDQDVASFYTSLGFWAFYFCHWSSCSEFLDVWCVWCFYGHWFL